MADRAGGARAGDADDFERWVARVIVEGENPGSTGIFLKCDGIIGCGGRRIDLIGRDRNGDGRVITVTVRILRNIGKCLS